MKEIIFAVSSLAGLGFLFGIMLAWMSKKFHVEVDPKISKVTELLPGINCGACGFAGCSNLAEALAADQAQITACVACSADNKKAIATVLGFDHGKIEMHVRQIATIHCHGGKNCNDKFKYEGLEDCRIAALTMSGHKQCRFACLGQGTCVSVCPFKAITMGDEGLPVIDQKLCVGCKKCVASCPRQIIAMMPRDKKVYIKCCSRDKGPEVVKKCKTGCIACFKCVKECPVKAISIVDNLAVIDYSKCIGCKKCVEVCPRKIIFALPEK